MWNTIRNKIKNLTQKRAIILMYHQVIDRKSDPWQLAVPTELFDEQMHYVSKHFDVVPLRELASAVAKKKLRRKLLSITFDDGFTDNFINAAPVLERYALPATFFVSTHPIYCRDIFWWDELENILLHTEQLPKHLELAIKNDSFHFTFQKDDVLNLLLKQEIRAWNASMLPSNERISLFLQLWKALQPLPPHLQKKIIGNLKRWAGAHYYQSSETNVMNLNQISTLGKNPLFSIGAHTVHHPMLATHPAGIQRFEILESKNVLEKWLGQHVSTFAYPYGNYDSLTKSIVKESGFDCAVSTAHAAVKEQDDLYALPRVQVKKWNAKEFEQHLKTLAA